MSVTRFVISLSTIGMMVIWAGMVSSQDYPNKPIRIVTSPAGGGSDFASRLIAQDISGTLGQPVIVDNRPATILGEFVAKASPDGYTLLITGSTFLFAPLLRNMPYDPVRDFSPITILAKAPNVLAVHPSLPVKSVKELIALAKAKPGELNYAMAGSGGSIHLAAELFKSMAGVNIVAVNYKGAALALSALMSGEVQVIFGSASSVTPHAESGRLRALAVTSLHPSALALGLPTITASGLPGYELDSIDAMLAPAKVPGVIVKRLNQEVVRVLNQPDVKVKFLKIGVEVAPCSPEQLATTIKSEMSKWGKLINELGIREQ